MSYTLIRQAALDTQCLTGTYQGIIRHFAPYAVGRDYQGEDNVLAFQYAGGSRRRLSPGGQWRSFRVDGLGDLRINDDPWPDGEDNGRPNSCVTEVDVEAGRRKPHGLTPLGRHAYSSAVSAGRPGGRVVM
jgi:hypothetical protein